MKKERSGLRRKLAISMTLFAILLMVLIGGLVCGRYYTARMKGFNDDAFEFARTAADMINGDKVPGYVETFERDNHYYGIQSYLNSAQKETLVKYYYVVIPHEDYMVYVWDAGEPDDAYTLGFHEKYQSEENKEAIMAAMTDDPPDEVVVSTDDLYGFIASAYTPVYNSKGEAVAVACADLPLPGLIRGIVIYLAMLILSVAGATLVATLMLYATLDKGVVGPIRILKNSAEKMVDNLESDEEINIDIKTGDEIEDLANAFTKMDGDLREYIKDLSVITAEKERIGAELNVAADIQKSMLPLIFPAFPDIPEFDLYASMDPAREVGGDFYDFFMVDEDHIALVMADVSGKGIPASLFMMISKIFIKNNIQSGMSPCEALRKANEQLIENNTVEMFVTVWLAVFNIRTGKGIAANAGHEHPALRRNGGLFEMIKYKHAPAVGMIEDIQFREHEFDLSAGDTLFVYTDGATEATNESDEFFGEERLLAALTDYPDAEPEDVLVYVKNCIDEFVGEAPQFDDITMLAFKYNGSKLSLDEVRDNM